MSAEALKNAPQHVQLAVDLIMLLEQNDIPADVALEAINIVQQDLRNKVTQNDGVSA